MDLLQTRHLRTTLPEFVIFGQGRLSRFHAHYAYGENNLTMLSLRIRVEIPPIPGGASTTPASASK